MTDFNVIILAAGLSNRLFPLTKKLPKAVLPIFAGKSLLELTLHSLDAYASSIKDLCIIGGHGFDSLTTEVKRIEAGLSVRPRILYNPEYKTKNNCYSLLLGLVEEKAAELLVLNSDILYEASILERVIHASGTSLAIDNVKRLTEESMKVYTESGRITDISKNLEIGKSDGEYIGIAKIDKKDLGPLHEALDAVVTDTPHLFYEDAFRMMLQKRRFAAVNTDGRLWTEIDDAEDLQNAKQLYTKIYG